MAARVAHLQRMVTPEQARRAMPDRYTGTPSCCTACARRSASLRAHHRWRTDHHQRLIGLGWRATAA
jgi:hypothetical protein